MKLNVITRIRGSYLRIAAITTIGLVSIGFGAPLTETIPLTTDQRGPGFSRLQDGNQDGMITIGIGADEAQIQAPTVSCPPSPVTAESTSAAGAEVTLNTQVQDLDDDFVTVTWRVDGTSVQTDFVPGGGANESLSLTRTYSLGTHTVTITATDSNNESTLCSTTINVVSPTAADSEITGRITDADGTPVAGTVVRLSGDQNRKTITDARGRYHFDNVETNGFYTVTPSRVNYDFNPFNRSFSQLGQSTEAVFSGSFTRDTLNPIDTPEYFVRQQYVDVFGREPEEGGFNYWSDRILECVSDALCMKRRRIEVAAAFFIENEFQTTGSFIHCLYKGSLGRRPAYAEFSADRRWVTGGPNLEARKQAFAESFVGRAEFLSKYQNHTRAESFVDALIQSVRQTSKVDLSDQRASLVAAYNAGASLLQSRAVVVKAMSENIALKAAEYNSTFVLMEYFGYLRRDPDGGGQAFWLDVLSHREPGNFGGMICAFLTSTEYQRRFSSVVTHNNTECGR